MLTAAHCVYDNRSGKVCAGGNVYAGKRGESAILGCSSILKVFVHPRYQGARNNLERLRYNVALLYLKNELGDAAGWPSVSFCKLENLQVIDLEVCGHS